ncbi:MAG: hypothetical protein D6696_10715 [Acidobacteria bacterium]|nr:MAG: hypothetical protein D6696_10715 [Acidobacteriota bacterium]
MRNGHRHVVELGAAPASGLEQLAGLAESWGASWQQKGIAGGHLTLPVRAGLRRGLVEGAVSIEATKGGSRLTFVVEDSFYRVHYAAFFLVLIGGLGGLFTMVAPFVPSLLPLLPLAMLLAIGAWFLIASRLRSRGPEEFFHLLVLACA